MWWKKKDIKDRTESASGRIAGYSCSKCRHQIKVPKDYIGQFKPGGKEYHFDGKSYLHCPHCAEMIEIK